MFNVGLTATNASGSNNLTSYGYVTSTGSGDITYYCEMYQLSTGCSLVSGSINDTYVADGSYMHMSCDPSNQHFHIRVDFKPVQLPAQVAKIKLDYQLHVSRSDNPNLSLAVIRQGGGEDYMWGPGLFSTTDQVVSFTTTSPATYEGSDGWIITDICGCPVSGNTNNYDVYLDLARCTVTPLTGSAPVANFSGTPTTGAAPLAVTFTDSSTNTPTVWSWTFGDSNTSTAQNPSHTYSSVGSYTVALTATNAYGNNTNTKNNYITVGNPPVANFSGSPTSGAAPLAVTFTDSSTNTPTAWSWTFGDSNTSTAQNPSHTYSSAGSYTVALTATNAYGNNTNTKNNYITVGNAPVANFSGTPTIGAPTLTVAFTDSSTNTPTAWSWTFGDSNTSTVQNPSHGYTAVGSYTVALTATNAYGNNTNTKASYVTVGNKPVANFTGTPTIGAPTLTVTFTDSSTYTPTAWSWNFGDSTTSTVQSPSHSYTAVGTYSVALTATNVYGNNTLTRSNYITVGNKPVANFSGTPTVGAPNTSVAFTDSSTYTPTAWSWTFGDSNTSTVQNPSHTYAAVGSYTVALTATNAYGNNTNTKSGYITIGNPPVANFSGAPTSGAAPLAVTFTDSSTNSPTAWSWTFGDSNTSTVQNPSHTYSSAGTYTVALTATNAYGNNTNTKSSYITVSSSAPVANFSGTPTSGTAPVTVAFTDSSTNTPTAWSWSFGDTSASTVQNASHTYTASGTYTVALTATNQYGYNTNTKSNYITVNAYSASAPTYVAAGAIASGTGAITPALPSGIATNDILLLSLETANQAITIPTPNGGTWTQVTNSPQNVGSGTTATSLTIFWSRYNGTQGAPTTSDSGDHQQGRIIAIRGASTVGDPTDGTAGGTDATANTTGSIPGCTTTFANDLVVTAIATSLPDASGTANFSGWTNANLSSLTERTDNTVTAGNGGGLGVATGVKATAGAVGSTSVTLANSSTKAMMSIALRPANSQMAKFPTSWSYANGKYVNLISGSLTDLQAKDSNYMVIQCDTTPGRFWYSARYTSPTGYTTSQVNRLTIDYVAKTDSAGNPGVGSWCSILQSDGSTWANIGQDWLPGTSDTGFTWTTTSPSTYMQSDGSVVFQYCGCPSAMSAYSISSNLMRATLTLN